LLTDSHIGPTKSLQFLCSSSPPLRISTNADDDFNNKQQQRYGSGATYHISEAKKRAAAFLESIKNQKPSQQNATENGLLKPSDESCELNDDDITDSCTTTTANNTPYVEMNLMMGILEAKRRHDDVLLPTPGMLEQLAEESAEQESAYASLLATLLPVVMASPQTLHNCSSSSCDDDDETDSDTTDTCSNNATSDDDSKDLKTKECTSPPSFPIVTSSLLSSSKHTGITEL
jgi:hypothetical protein